MAYCLLLVYIEKVETSPLTTLNLSNVFDQGSQDTLMQHAKQRARVEFGNHIFRSDPAGSGGGSESGGSGAKTWNGGFNRDKAAAPCITFNLGRTKHPANCLNERGVCRFAHVCDHYVSDKGKGGICRSPKHTRLTCDNPNKCDAPAE